MLGVILFFMVQSGNLTIGHETLSWANVWCLNLRYSWEITDFLCDRS